MANESHEVIVASSPVRAYLCGITTAKRRLHTIVGIILITVTIMVAAIPTVIILTTQIDTPTTEAIAPSATKTTHTTVGTTTSTATTSDLLTTTSAPMRTSITVPMSTTTTVTTSTTSVMTTRVPEWIKTTNETVHAIWNTTAGKDSTRAIPGTGTGSFWSSQPPEAAMDHDLTTEYTNHGDHSGEASKRGLDTGFYITFNTNPFILSHFYMATNSEYVTRDPLTMTIEGSNQPKSTLTVGTSWNLIYNGSSGLETDPGRLRFGPKANSAEL